MKAILLQLGLSIALPVLLATAGEPTPIHSPGLPPSHMDADGRLVEDWGTVGVVVSGEGVVDAPTTVEATKLDDVIPAARAVSPRGAVRLVWTAYRAPAFPSGVDMLTVRVEETKGQAAEVTVGLDVSAGVQIGTRTAKVGGRTVLTLPEAAEQDQPTLREWGYCDEATSLSGWAKPEGDCDPAFRNIRAGLGGVPIVYRFTVTPGSAANVVLGFCESHWADRGQRPLSCRVEGAPPQQVDPVAEWGQHKPGALVFAARDENGDGRLEILVRCAAGAQDRNPILNAIWIFPQGEAPQPAKVVSGAWSAAAVRYVDVGGENDQSIYPPGKLEYRLSLQAGEAKELVFCVASPGGSAPIPATSAWTADALHRAAGEVWRDWTEP
jgi:hypothetical protein